MIHSFQLGLIETTLGTHPRWSIKIDRLGLNACNEKKHGPPRVHILKKFPAKALASFSFRVSCIFFPVVNRELLLRKRYL